LCAWFKVRCKAAQKHPNLGRISQNAADVRLAVAHFRLIGLIWILYQPQSCFLSCVLRFKPPSRCLSPSHLPIFGCVYRAKGDVIRATIACNATCAITPKILYYRSLPPEFGAQSTQARLAFYGQCPWLCFTCVRRCLFVRLSAVQGK